MYNAGVQQSQLGLTEGVTIGEYLIVTFEFLIVQIEFLIAEFDTASGHCLI